MMGKVIVYGIANCDTIKKAKNWLDRKGIVYDFHDYRKQGLDSSMLTPWVDSLGWEALLNRRGTTWRKLSEDVKETIDRDSAIAIMLENPSIIKRPLLIKGDEQFLGFSDSDYQDIFK